MPKAMTTALEEFEVIEGDDALHDFGGSHGGKGHDFASFWVIQRVTELEQAKPSDYLFVCEYMQDVAEFDSSTVPTRVQLYQLKKKEDGYWTPLTLTGQSGKAKVPNPDKPIWKLLRHVRTVTIAKATGAFVTNGKFKVELASGQSSVNDTRIGLDKQDAEHASKLKAAIAADEGNLDYILELIFEHKKSKSELVDEVRRVIRASLGNRAKESLLVDFINQTDLDQLGDKASVIDAFFKFAQAEQQREALDLITTEDLNADAAKRYITASLKREFASENGTELNAVLPKMSPLNPQFKTKKQTVFQKIAVFVEKFKGVGGQV